MKLKQVHLFKVVLHPNQKLACFMLFLKIINTCLKNNICILGHEKKKPCFMGRQTFQVGSIGRDIFLNIFFLSGGKNDSPKNTEISKKKKKKPDVFGEKF